MKKESEFMKGLNKEIDNRIHIMEQDDFVGVPRMKKADYGVSFALQILSALALVCTYHFMC